jgi:hypothetical protein
LIGILSATATLLGLLATASNENLVRKRTTDSVIPILNGGKPPTPLTSLPAGIPSKNNRAVGKTIGKTISRIILFALGGAVVGLWSVVLAQALKWGVIWLLGAAWVAANDTTVEVFIWVYIGVSTGYSIAIHWASHIGKAIAKGIFGEFIGGIVEGINEKAVGYFLLFIAGMVVGLVFWVSGRLIDSWVFHGLLTGIFFGVLIGTSFGIKERDILN